MKKLSVSLLTCVLLLGLVFAPTAGAWPWDDRAPVDPGPPRPPDPPICYPSGYCIMP